MHAQDLLPTRNDFDLLPLTFSDQEGLPNIWDRVESLGSRTDFRTEWGEWEAIRELVQNALDASPQIKLLYEDTSEISYIVDNGKGIIKSDLLYGESKRKTPYSIHCLRGTYGEGLKIGIIALMRMGHRVIIRTVNYDYHFSIQNSVEYRGMGDDKEKIDYQQLFWFRRGNAVSKGTTISIENVNCLKYRNRFASFVIEDNPELLLLSVKIDPAIANDAKIEMEQAEAKIKDLKEKATPAPSDESNLEVLRKFYQENEKIWLEHCKVRQILNLPGKIYVRDIFVTTMPAYFGYNFWFDDTKDILPPNRNEIKSVYSLITEYEFFLKSSNQEVLTRLFETIYYGQCNTSEQLEWKVLDSRRFESLTQEEATNLFIILFKIVGAEFCWSRNVEEQKLLEHFRITDLTKKFPDLRDLFVRYNLVKDPRDLARATDLLNQTIVITEEEIRNSDLEHAAEIADIIKKLKEELECIIYEVQRTNKPTGLHFYGGNFKSDDEKIGGYYNRTSNQIYIHIKNLIDSEDLLRVLIHELAHASCDDCKDVTAEFISALQNIAAKVFTYIRKGTCDFEGIASAAHDIDNYYKDELESYVYEKSIKIASPRGITRPPDFDDHYSEVSDKAKIDQIMLKISQEAYADYNDIKLILMGYTSHGKYSVAHHWNRGKGPYTGKSYQNDRKKALTNQEILKRDVETLKKLGLSVPIKAELGTINVDKWDSLVNSPSAELDPEYLIEGENWSDPDLMIKFILEHPQPHIKSRNFRALMRYINPKTILNQKLEEQKIREDVDSTWDIEESVRRKIVQDYQSGKFADQQWLIRLRDVATRIADLEHPSEAITGHDVYYYPLKEKLLEAANRFDWVEVIKHFINARSSHLRAATIDVLAQRGMLQEIIEAEKTEGNERVLRRILSWLGRSFWSGESELRMSEKDFIEFFKAKLPKYRKILEHKSAPYGSDEYYQVEEFEKELNSYEHRIKLREGRQRR